MPQPTPKAGGLLSRWNQRREQVAAEEALDTQGQTTPQQAHAINKVDETVLAESTQATEAITEVHPQKMTIQTAYLPQRIYLTLTRLQLVVALPVLWGRMSILRLSPQRYAHCGNNLISMR